MENQKSRHSEMARIGTALHTTNSVFSHTIYFSLRLQKETWLLYPKSLYTSPRVDVPSVTIHISFYPANEYLGFLFCPAIISCIQFEFMMTF